ncbi:hypothetical protein AgCh_038607 [Apium graveolens]
MAANSMFFTATSSILTKPIIKIQSFSTPSFGFSKNTSVLAHRVCAGKQFLAVAAAASSAVEVEADTAVIKASKVLPFRVGHGFDLHRLEPGYPLIIGGIDIPFEKGCEAHSDGDVLLHCVVDAILGALGLPDIGQIFPDNDPKWKGARSSVFIKEAVSSFLLFFVLGSI